MNQIANVPKPATEKWFLMDDTELIDGFEQIQFVMNFNFSQGWQHWKDKVKTMKIPFCKNEMKFLEIYTYIYVYIIYIFIYIYEAN